MEMRSKSGIPILFTSALLVCLRIDYAGNLGDIFLGLGFGEYPAYHESYGDSTDSTYDTYSFPYIRNEGGREIISNGKEQYRYQ